MLPSGPTCKMCRQRPAGAHAHVWPRALCMEIGSPTEPLYAIPRDSTQRELRRRTGPYDTTILCDDCERRFSIYDDLGVRAMRTMPSPVPGSPNPEIHALLGIDARMLKLFFMHVLWRAHASSLPDFSQVRLGPRGDDLRQLLLADDPGGSKDFNVLLAFYQPDPDGFHNTMSVTVGRWKNGVRPRYCEITWRQWSAIITTTSTGLPDAWLPGTVRPGRPVPVMAAPYPYRQGRHFKVMAELLRE